MCVHTIDRYFSIENTTQQKGFGESKVVIMFLVVAKSCEWVNRTDGQMNWARKGYLLQEEKISNLI